MSKNEELAVILTDICKKIGFFPYKVAGIEYNEICYKPLHTSATTWAYYFKGNSKGYIKEIKSVDCYCQISEKIEIFIMGIWPKISDKDKEKLSAIMLGG